MTPIKFLQLILKHDKISDSDKAATARAISVLIIELDENKPVRHAVLQHVSRQIVQELHAQNDNPIRPPVELTEKERDELISAFAENGVVITWMSDEDGRGVFYVIS